MNLIEQLNFLGKKREPFFTLISYDLSQYEVIPLKDLPSDILYILDQKELPKSHPLILQKNPLSYTEYQKQFDAIFKEIQSGNTYLINLTAPTIITNTYPLKTIFEKANGKFKLYYKDQFVTFSPERFCQIKENSIYTYPMKGTIDRAIPNAEEMILNDPKEFAEHTMVVDLLLKRSFNRCDKRQSRTLSLYGNDSSG